jgi:hypothetical protein
LPVWRADVDPCVLRARVLAHAGGGHRLFDAKAVQARCLASRLGEHVAFSCAGEIARIDIVAGSVSSGPAVLAFDILADTDLDRKLAALRRIYARTAGAGVPRRLRRLHLALLVRDARIDGASWCEAADLLLGPGDWPGDGEHRKSVIRRLAEAASALCRSGAGAILRGTV